MTIDQNTSKMQQPDHDAIIVGAGFAGIYMCKKLTDQGLTVKVLEAAPDVGGTWFWNRYPGAMSDSPSFLYRYSWDLEDLREYPWNRRYLQQPEVLAYLCHVVERHGLRPYMQFNTEMVAAAWDNTNQLWIVETSSQKRLTARYLVTAMGVLSRRNYPDLPGQADFKGEIYHSSAWPQSYDFKGKRVGVIGNGSTGVQILTALAKEAEGVQRLISFQRNPQYVVPAGDGEIPAAIQANIKDNYMTHWKQAKESMLAFGFEESQTPTFSVTAEEREHIFEAAWKRGGGFDFMFNTFCDLTIDEEANQTACEFIKRKIQTIVKSPIKAQRLMPTQLFARRPLCATHYYEMFNEDHVDIVNIGETPIMNITNGGIRTSDGVVHELDVIVFATGFDAVDGSFAHIPIQGASGHTLKDQWTLNGPSSFLGISVANFPNLFMVLGPGSPFTNIPPTIETQVEFISDMIERQNALAPHAQRHIIEASQEAVEEWRKLCHDLTASSLFRRTGSWVFGSNVVGKKPSVLFYFGGLGNYRKALDEVTRRTDSPFNLVHR